MSRSKDQGIRARAWRAWKENVPTMEDMKTMEQVVSGTTREDMARKLREHGWVVIPPAPLVLASGESIWVEYESDSLIHVHIGRARYTLKTNEAFRLVRLLGKWITK